MGQSVSEQIRHEQRVLDVSISNLDRHRKRSRLDEKRLKQEIRVALAKNDMATAKILARDVNQVRHFAQRYATGESQLRQLSNQLHSIATADQLTSTMKEASRIMASFKTPKIQKTALEFAKQTTQMDLKQEMIDEALDMSLQPKEEDEEEQEEEIVNRIVDEIRLEMPTPKQSRRGAASAASALAEVVEDD
jgi:charged multivesicular body protein 2A